MPAVVAQSPAQTAPGNKATPLFDQRSPLHVRELVGTARIGRGDTVTSLPTASQPTELLRVTFQDASGQSCPARYALIIDRQSTHQTAVADMHKNAKQHFPFSGVHVSIQSRAVA